MCDQQRLRPACAYAQSDQSLSWSLAYSMSVKLLTEHHFEFRSLNGGYIDLSESAFVKNHIVGNHMSRLIYEATQAKLIDDTIACTSICL